MARFRIAFQLSTSSTSGQNDYQLDFKMTFNLTSNKFIKTFDMITVSLKRMLFAVFRKSKTCILERKKTVITAVMINALS